MRLYDQLLSGVFLVAISLPLASQLTGLSPAKGKLPAVDKKFPAKFANFYGENFGLRDHLVRAHAVGTYRLLRESPSDQVWFGRDGWLYYAKDSSDDDYRSLKPFTVTELERWRQVLEERAAWLAKRNAKFVVVWACDKHMIYPEYLPAGLRRGNAPYRVDVLADCLAKYSSLTQVALHEPLRAAKSDRLYHRTDTHWNDRGAYVGYREILAKLGMTPLDYAPVEVTGAGWDLTRMVKLPDLIPEEDRQLQPKFTRRAKIVDIDRPDPTWNVGRVALEVDDGNLPRLVMFRDSFGSALVPFLAEHFSRSLFLWQYDFDPATIEREKPDVVIWLMTSRRLQWYEPVNPALPPLPEEK